MSILDKLKAIGLHIPKLKSLVSIKFEKLIHIDRSIRIEGSSISIDPSSLNGKQKRALKRLIREDLLSDAGAIIEEKSEPRVREVLKTLPSKEEISKKLIPIIPSADIPLLYACLFLRRRAQLQEPVEELKSQIVRVYGQRGGNFANLCSEGYLESWFWPLYEELLSAYPDQPAAARAQFQIHYNRIVSDLPWTEFVAARADADAVTTHIIEKMQRNISNGIRYFNVHGLGIRNVKKIEKLIPEIQKKTGALAILTEKTETRIFIRLEIHQKSLV
jgi:hypothetical protein